MVDERIKIPIFWRGVVGIYLGLCLIHLSFNDIVNVDYGDTFTLLLGAFGGAILIYGLVVLVANIRIGKTNRGIKKEIKKNIDNAFKKFNGNR